MTFPDFCSLPGAVVFHIQPDVEHCQDCLAKVVPWVPISVNCTKLA